MFIDKLSNTKSQQPSTSSSRQRNNTSNLDVGNKRGNVARKSEAALSTSTSIQRRITNDNSTQSIRHQRQRPKYLAKRNLRESYKEHKTHKSVVGAPVTSPITSTKQTNVHIPLLQDFSSSLPEYCTPKTAKVHFQNDVQPQNNEMQRVNANVPPLQDFTPRSQNYSIFYSMPKSDKPPESDAPRSNIPSKNDVSHKYDVPSLDHLSLRENNTYAIKDYTDNKNDSQNAVSINLGKIFQENHERIERVYLTELDENVMNRKTTEENNNNIMESTDHMIDFQPTNPIHAWGENNTDNENEAGRLVSDRLLCGDEEQFCEEEGSSYEESGSSEYDTDIEDHFQVDFEPKPFDPSGKVLYKRQCQKKQLVPITRFMRQLTNKSLNLKYHGLGWNSSLATSESLLSNSCIERLDLSNNHIKSEGGLAFVKMLHENTFLSDINFSNNNLGSEVGVALAKLLMENTTIKRLILKENKFTDRVAKAFAEAFKVNKTLFELDLSYNDFCEQGGLYIGAGLALNEGLETLNLKWNCIRGKGAVSIAAALSKNNFLRELDLSWNGLAFIGCLAIGRYLKKNMNLEGLDISNNRIGGNGATKLAPALAGHPALRTFKIGQNPIGDEGVTAILKSLKKNSSINSVSFEDIAISSATKTMIESIRSLKDITIITGGLGGYSKRKPPPGGMDALVQFIQTNRMRLTDLFFQWDKDKNGSISKDEFFRGLMETGLKMDKSQLHNLIDQLDKNGDGELDFGEILAGREMVISERRFQKKVERKTKQREMDSIQLPKLEGF